MERDNSPEAIMQRYDKANRLAIASHNAIMFDSIRDVYHLLKKVEDLKVRIVVLEEELRKANESNDESV